MNNKVSKFKEQLNLAFLEREEIIEASLACMLAGEHILFLGLPGTGKSMLARSINDSIAEAKYFEALLTRFTAPEEIFGAISLKGLQNDRFERIINNKLPEANIAFLDEIFKSSSAILNSLLAILNERVFYNNGTKIEIPLLSIFGASNELPQAEDLSALYDRFLVKFWINYVSENSFRSLITLSPHKIKPIFTISDIRESQKECENIVLSNSTIDSLEKLRNAFGVEGISLSDRKWRQSIKIIKAVAWLGGQSETSAENIEILKHVAWNNPNDILKVSRIVATICNPLGSVLLDLEDEASEIYDNAVKAGTSDSGAEANQKLKKIQKKMDSMLKDHPTQKKQITIAKEKIQEMNKKIVKEILGLDI